MSIKADIALDKLQAKTGEKVPIELYYRQDKRAFKRECIHWFFHVLVVGALVLIMYEFLQYDTFSYEQDGTGQNVIGVEVGGDVNVTKGTDSEEKGISIIGKEESEGHQDKEATSERPENRTLDKE